MNGVCVVTVNSGANIVLRWIFSRENLYALILCVILIAILVLTSDQAPAWIYQGF